MGQPTTDRPRERRQTPRFAYEIDVSAQTPDGLVRGTTRDISAGGLFLVTDRPAPLEARLRLVVGGWADRAPIVFGGVVRHSVPPGQEGVRLGMGIAVDDIDDEMQRRWIRLVAGVAQAIDDRLRDSHRRADGSNPVVAARRYARHRVQIAVRIPEIDGPQDLDCRDVSAGGVFVNCESRLDPGATVKVTLRHRISHLSLTLRGRVARANPDGIGIEFVGLPAGAREELHAFLISGNPLGGVLQS